MASRTLYLARLIGLSLLLLGVALLVNRADLASILTTLSSDPAFLFTYGLVSLVVGLAMVLAHNLWRGGVLQVAVTVVGWLMLLRGVALLLVPAATISAGVARAHVADHDGVWGVLVAVIGVLFILGGFWSGGVIIPARRHAPHAPAR